MKTINSTDVILATIEQRGRTVGKFRIEGYSSLNAIIGGLRQMLHDCIGVVKLTLHNTTQGWREARSMFFEKSEPRWGKAIQLSLF